MKKNEYKTLVLFYGEKYAKRALAWFCEHSQDFRDAIKAQAEFCSNNEYLWVGNA